MKQTEIENLKLHFLKTLPKIKDLTKEEKEIVRQISEVRLQTKAIQSIETKLKDKNQRLEDALFCSLYNRGIR